MKTKWLPLIVIIFFLLPVSCVEKYWPDLGDRYEEALVVDGSISDNPGPYTVRLSTSSSVQFPKLKPYTGCSVIIIEEDGISETLIEQEPGVYHTSSQGITAVVGKKYKIQISTPNERTYESSYERLTEAVDIASVYAELETKESEELPYKLKGFQFYLDTRPAQNDTNYFLWKLESTFKYRADYLIRDLYTNRNISSFPQPDSFYTCWKTEAIPAFFTYETSMLSEPVITRFPLHYISTEGRDLSIRYSVIVRQLTVTSEAYTYWNSLREQSENQGNLYSKQPYQIHGNIQNVNDPGEPVMGYFMAAGIAEQRIYIDRPILTFNYWICELNQADYEAVGDLRFTRYNDWPIYLTRDNNGVLAWPDERCLDCRERGGTIFKPEFWED